MNTMPLGKADFVTFELLLHWIALNPPKVGDLSWCLLRFTYRFCYVEPLSSLLLHGADRLSESFFAFWKIAA